MKSNQEAVVAKNATTEKWETVIDFTKFRKGGIPVEELLARLEAMNHTSAELGRRKKLASSSGLTPKA